jgi:hypothetical protein
MSTRGDVARDFLGLGIGKRQDRFHAPCWTHCSEQISVVVALIGGLPWPRSVAPWRTRLFSCPIRTSSWNHIPRRRRRRLPDELSARAGSFFKFLDDPLVLHRMARSRADVGEAELLQKFPTLARIKLTLNLSAMTRLRSMRRSARRRRSHDRGQLPRSSRTEPDASLTGEALDPPSSYQTDPPAPKR